MKTIIIGGSATGMGVAARLKRNDPSQEITVYQNHDYVSLGACGLPYYVAGNFEDKNNLIARQVEAFEKNGIKVVINTLVEDIDFASKKISFTNFEGVKGEDTYDDLVIAVGAKPIVPPLPGVNSENVFTLTSLEDGVKVREALHSNNEIKSVAVIGAGFIGLEVCESLIHLNRKVTLIEMSKKISPRVYDPEISEMLENELVNKGVNLLLNSQLTEILEKDGKACGVKLSDGTIIEADAVLMSVGFTPNTNFLKNTELSMNERNVIIVDEMGRTNIKNVWSAGDCATSKSFITGEDIYSPLATVASKFARVIADNIVGKQAKFVGSLQTAIVRVFDKEAARTGLTENDCKEKGIDYKAVLINDKDHTNYVPGQSDLTLKLIMNNKTRELIGAQMVGNDKAVLRINGIISLIWAKIKVDEVLEQIDLPYAPPFARTTDILHIALSKLNK